jgi:hypothetical protein
MTVLYSTNPVLLKKGDARTRKHQIETVWYASRSEESDAVTISNQFARLSGRPSYTLRGSRGKRNSLGH